MHTISMLYFLLLSVQNKGGIKLLLLDKTLKNTLPSEKTWFF